MPATRVWANLTQDWGGVGCDEFRLKIETNMEN